MRCRLLSASVLLLVGAALNVAVAWGCVWLAPGRPYEEGLPEPAAHRILERYGTDQSQIFYAKRTSALGRSVTYIFVDPYVSHALVHFEAGAPARSLCFGYHFNGGGCEVLTALEVPEWIAGRRGYLPLGPLWPGFIGNTVLYSAMVWLLAYGPFALRRFARLHRGRCPGCAYPMGASTVCSECGRTLGFSAGDRRTPAVRESARPGPPRP